MTSDDQHFIGYTITDVGRLLRTVFERRVRGFGLTRAQWLIIARLHRRPGLSQSEIADLLEIEKAPAGRLIERMEAKNWLQRRSDAKDKRVNRLYLTNKANRLHAAIWPIAEATVEAALGDLSAEERRRLSDLMARVKMTLQALAERDPARGEKAASDAEAEELRAP
jgi:MarR family transcriptional regulator, transcriptional regulator for hemolysin